MNRTQRSLLAFFAVVTLLSSSYSESSSLRYFLSATLLFFSLSPEAWFTKIQAISYVNSGKQNPSTEELLNETDDLDEIEDDTHDNIGCEIGGNKELFRISQENIAYCMGLYRLRIAEILRSYSEICMNYPDTEENDPWVLKLLKNCAKYEGPSWDYKNEQEEKKAEQEAILAYEKRFSHLFGWCPRPDDDEVIDIQIFLSVYNGAARKIVNHLEYFKEIDFATGIIQQLIAHYTVLLESVGDDYSFTKFMKHQERGSPEERIRDKARSSFIQIRSLWETINNLLMSMLNIAAATPINVSEASKELDMFSTLRTCFRERLLSKNEVDLKKSLIRTVSDEQDKIFGEFYKQPIYKHIF